MLCHGRPCLLYAGLRLSSFKWPSLHASAPVQKISFCLLFLIVCTLCRVLPVPVTSSFSRSCFPLFLVQQLQRIHSNVIRSGRHTELAGRPCQSALREGMAPARSYTVTGRSGLPMALPLTTAARHRNLPHPASSGSQPHSSHGTLRAMPPNGASLRSAPGGSSRRSQSFRPAATDGALTP